MNELKVFENAEFGKIRGVEIDGEVYKIAPVGNNSGGVTTRQSRCTLMMKINSTTKRRRVWDSAEDG